MTALFLAMFPVIAYAAFRAFASLGVGRAGAASAAVALGLVATLPPFLLFRTDPGTSGAAPAEGETLEVLFHRGWEPAVTDARGRRVRWMRERAELVLGQLVGTRPPAIVSFRAEGVERARRLTATLGADVLAVATVPATGTRVRIEVPPGEGPAVLVLAAEPAAARPAVAVLAHSVEAVPQPAR